MTAAPTGSSCVTKEAPEDDVLGSGDATREVLMQVKIKIWRFDSQTGERALKEYEIEAPE